MADNGTPLILLTRPKAQSARFAAACEAEFGPHAETAIVPLQAIVATTDTPDLTGIAGLIFSSENGVRCFARSQKSRDLPVWCVGAHTTEIARDLDFNAQFAGPRADALVAALQAQRPQTPLLHLRGQHARGEIAARLTAAGLPTREAVLYDQRAIDPAPPLATLGADRRVLVPLFSPRSAVLLARSLPVLPPRWQLLCLSEAVADALPGPFRASAQIAGSPDAQAMQRLVRDHISP